MQIRTLALITIRLYQKTLSLDHGPLKHLFPGGYCKFYPSCSQYGHTCIERHGVFKGGAFTGWRILRCNPFSAGGIDEAPDKK
ncbi:membrane protein insertion efficiency factor YidD [Candidatus Uhrbacteria bacterium]|nr:membrane protein insertion efficiency factor YidD [Candidatus Uhrbacteria bacterium]